MRDGRCLKLKFCWWMGYIFLWFSFCFNILLIGSVVFFIEVYDLMDRFCCKGWGKVRFLLEEGGKM